MPAGLGHRRDQVWPPVGVLRPVARDLQRYNLIASTIRQETYSYDRQVENTSIGATGTKCTSYINKIHAEISLSRKLLAEMQLSLDSYTASESKTPQSASSIRVRDQKVLECEEKMWTFTHNSYTNRLSLSLELEEDKEEKRTSKQKKVTYQMQDGTEKSETFKPADVDKVTKQRLSSLSTRESSR